MGNGTVRFARFVAVCFAWLALHGCSKKCSKDTDCPLLEHCSEGKCVAVPASDATVYDAAVAPNPPDPDADAAEAPTVTGICVEECVDDDDCISEIGSLYRCSEQGRCEYACTDNPSCIPLASEWQSRCTADADCSPSYECVEFDGDGNSYCAREPPCLDGSTQVMRPQVADGGSDVPVCEVATWECRDGTCFQPPCDTDDDCKAPHPSHCNLATHECDCDENSDCAQVPGMSTCDNHRCICTAHTDCTGTSNANVCVSGTCGCSDAGACNEPRFSGTFVCEPN